MDRDEAKKRILKLREQIKKHDYNYYVNNAPLISDYIYDSVYNELKTLEKEFPEFADPDSPTQRVSERTTDFFEKVHHEPKMYSLDNAYSETELIDFDGRLHDKLGNSFTYSVEPKIDGIAVSIIYRNGVIYKGITRGDGTIGDDVTANIKTIKSLPQHLKSAGKGDLTVRGEVFFLKSRFEEISEIYDFANARNAAAGTMKLFDPKETEKRGLNVIIHTVITNIKPTHIETMAELHKMGLPVVKTEIAYSIEEVINIKNRYEKERYSFEYETDGMVVKINELNLREEAGYTNK